MSDEKSGPGIGGWLRGLFAKTEGKIQDKLADAISLGVLGVLTAIGLWLRHSSTAQLLLLGGVLTVLLRMLVGAGVSFARYLRRPPPESPAPPPPAADSAGVTRLQEVYLGCQPALIFAIDYLKGLEPTGRCRELVRELVREQIVPDCQKDEEKLAVRFHLLKLPITPSEFDELKELFKQAMDVRYKTLLTRILQVGDLAMGRDALLASEEYDKLYGLHREAIREMGRVRDNPEIGRIALLCESLADLLPPSLLSSQG